MDNLQPKDHGEAVATFRHGIIGGLAVRELAHGDLAAQLKDLALQRYRAPGAASTRKYAASTLERWLYAYRTGGLDALRPRGRSDRGRGRELEPELRDLLCAIRREHPSASVSLILATLIAEGRIEKDTVKASTVRRLFAEKGLTRRALRETHDPKLRLRWQTEHPDTLWHGDVCHGAPIKVGDLRIPVRIHGLMDDCSRYIIALEAHETEREEDMLAVFVRTLRTHGQPEALYLDNGSTYRGETLSTACARLGIGLLHARPYDPQARGKMERFWRTLREGCLDHLGEIRSLAELNGRLQVFLERVYHVRPHAGLMGRTPRAVYAPLDRVPNRIDEALLRAALTVRERRRVRRDTTLQVLGVTYELEQSYLAGQTVTVAYALVDDPVLPWVEDDGRRLALHRVDPIRNARRARPEQPRPEPAKTTGFDPARLCEATSPKEINDHANR